MGIFHAMQANVESLVCHNRMGLAAILGLLSVSQLIAVLVGARGAGREGV